MLKRLKSLHLTLVNAVLLMTLLVVYALVSQGIGSSIQYSLTPVKVPDSSISNGTSHGYVRASKSTTFHSSSTSQTMVTSSRTSQNSNSTSTSSKNYSETIGRTTVSISKTSPISDISTNGISFKATTPHREIDAELDCVIAKMPMMGRLGNELFLYATLFGVSTRYNRTAMYNAQSRLYKIFNISALPYWENIKESDFKVKREKMANVFDGTVLQYVSTNHGHLLLKGYFQSFRYFDRYQDLIKQEFTFHNAIAIEVQSFLYQSAMAAFGGTLPLLGVIYIGVHIRRGDMTTLYSHNRGYIEAPVQYLNHAVQFFRETQDPQRILFVVVTDDMTWSIKHFDSQGNRKVFSAYEKKPDHDLALLASCNHTIMTVGSFGWWGAFLAGGTTVYYKDFPRQGTYIDRIFNRKDYFPSKWVGLR